MTVTDLPAINACLNAAATVFIVAGLVFIKSGKTKAHIISMIGALTVSAVFLACYLYYHYHAGHVAFAGTGLPLLLCLVGATGAVALLG